MNPSQGKAKKTSSRAASSRTSVAARQTFTKKPLSEEIPEGQLALDVYQTKTHIVVVAPIAGVKLSDIKVSITEDVLSIKGKRQLDFDIPEEDYFTQECFWGDFSRTIVLPSAVDSTKINASFKDAILKITIPKTERTKTKVVRIKAE